MSVEVEKKITLDLLDVNAPALSSTSDMPVEVKADAVPAAPAKEEAVVEATPEAGKTTSESATEHTEEDPGEPAEEVKKPPRGVQKRLDELAKREADAVRRAEALQAMLDRELAAKVPPKPEPEKPVTEDDAPKRPSKAEFVDNQEGYDQALDDYIAERASYEATKAVKADRAEQESKAQQKAIEDGQRAVQTAYVGRVEKAKEKYADYLAVAESPEVEVSIPMAHAIVHSEYGPDIAYHLGDDARKGGKEAERISKLSPPLQLVELGKIVAKLETPVAKPEVKAEPIKPPVSNAPKPIKPLGAGSESASKSAEEESMDEYAARRKKELAAERRPGMRH